MSRRSFALLLAAVLAIGLFIAGWLLPVPYVILTPGETWDTLGPQTGSRLPLIDISGHPVYQSGGHLILLTVYETGGPGSQPTLFSALSAWLNHEDAVIPQQVAFPPGQTSRQVQQENALEMQRSQEDAITAALGELAISGSISVQSADPSTPAGHLLKTGDVIERIDQRPVRQIPALLNYIHSLPVGRMVTLFIHRDGRPMTVHAPTVSQEGETVIGFVPMEIPPFQIRIDLQNVGGPSAGMMFALGIVDKLTPGGITAGRSIAGTGEITFAGDVLPIGGIQQKVFAALHAGATVMLAPASECPSARRVAPPRLRLIPVTTLHGAVDALRALSRGQRVPSC